jgi:hypothetical protein
MHALGGLIVALWFAGTLAACDSGKPGSSKAGAMASGTAASSANGPQALTAPKVGTGKVDLSGRCDDAYAVDVEDGGIITECTLGAAFKVGDVTCAKDSRPQTYDDRSLRSCVIEGVLAAGGLECHQAVYFYPDGAIQTCQLKRPVQHLGKTCKTKVEFNTDGAFRECH